MGHKLMGSDYRHRAGANGHSYCGRLAVLLAVICALLAMEVVGALLSGSLVLLAEAGRMATDAVGIGLLLLLLWLVARPATPEQTFGYYRLQLLAACVNAVLLFGVGAYVVVEAVRRLVHPTEVASGILLVFGTVALVGNGCWLWLLRHGQVERRTVDAGSREVVIGLFGAVAVNGWWWSGCRPMRPTSTRLRHYGPTSRARSWPTWPLTPSARSSKRAGKGSNASVGRGGCRIRSCDAPVLLVWGDHGLLPALAGERPDRLDVLPDRDVHILRRGRVTRLDDMLRHER
jgi:Co/Zn/Cd efflux system component